MLNEGKRPVCHMRTAKVQVSVRIRAVWYWHSLCVDLYYSNHWFCIDCAGWSGPSLSANCIRALFVRCVSYVQSVRGIILIFCVFNNLAPTYLRELFQMRDVNHDNTASNLRSVSEKNYILPQAKCNLFKGSLSFSGIIVWNSIPVNIKNSQSLDIFVKRCTYWIKH